MQCAPLVAYTPRVELEASSLPPKSEAPLSHSALHGPPFATSRSTTRGACHPGWGDSSHSSAVLPNIPTHCGPKLVPKLSYAESCYKRCNITIVKSS